MEVERVKVRQVVHITLAQIECADGGRTSQVVCGDVGEQVVEGDSHDGRTVEQWIGDPGEVRVSPIVVLALRQLVSGQGDGSSAEVPGRNTESFEAMT